MQIANALRSAAFSRNALLSLECERSDSRADKLALKYSCAVPLA